MTRETFVWFGSLGRCSLLMTCLGRRNQTLTWLSFDQESKWWMQQPNKFSLSLTAICSCLRLIHQYNLTFGHICGKQSMFSSKLKISNFHPGFYSLVWDKRRSYRCSMSIHWPSLQVNSPSEQVDSLINFTCRWYDHLMTWSSLIIWAGQYDDLMPWWSEYLSRILSHPWLSHSNMTFVVTHLREVNAVHTLKIG